MLAKTRILTQVVEHSSKTPMGLLEKRKEILIFFSSVFKSELIAIDEGLSCITSSLEPKSIWILSNSRSAIQHLSNWCSVGDKTGISILNKLKQVHFHVVSHGHFQWIPSHVDGEMRRPIPSRRRVPERLWLHLIA
ncbi:hypothetical protein TNCV_4275701 [Trichonephila clavipes]|nr:hypothetical protein TNCV_4275701 [Trichonephila clavipes]